jgi:hypothetical protein
MFRTSVFPVFKTDNISLSIQYPAKRVRMLIDFMKYYAEVSRNMSRVTED